MFFCDFCEIFKSTFFTGSLRVTTSGSSGCYLKAYQNDINWGNNSDFNAITLEAAIQHNLTKSWRFSREMSVVEFRYSIKL